MKKENKNRGKIFSIFIVVIMTMSVLGFLFGSGNSNDQEYKYDKWTFIRTGSQWVTKYNDKQLFFDYFPEQVTDISINQDIISKLNVLEVDLTYDSNDSLKEAIALSHYMMQQNLGQVSNLYLRQGLTSNNTFNLPIITCEDSTDAVPIIYFKESNETKAYLQDKCIILEADSEIDILRIKDRLLYGYLGIIK